MRDCAPGGLRDEALVELAEGADYAGLSRDTIYTAWRARRGSGTRAWAAGVRFGCRPEWDRCLAGTITREGAQEQDHPGIAAPMLEYRLRAGGG